MLALLADDEATEAAETADEESHLESDEAEREAE